MTQDGRAAEPAYLALPRRVEAAAVGALLAISLLAWAGTIEDAHSMRGMAMGLGQLGTRVQGPMGVTLFLAMWVTMMTAMMLPAVAPTVLAHLAIARRRGDGFVPTFVARHDFPGGARSALRAGVIHGAYCLGCCSALMLVLLVVGLMNLAWMAGLFALIYVERTWWHGLALAKGAGGALIAVGIAVAARPALLELVSR